MTIPVFPLLLASVGGLVPLAALGICGHFLRRADQRKMGAAPPPKRWLRYPNMCVRRSLAGLTRLLEEKELCNGRQAIVATDCLDAFSHWAIAGPVLALAASGTLVAMPWYVTISSGVACLAIALAVGTDSWKTMRRRLEAHALRYRRKARRRGD